MILNNNETKAILKVLNKRISDIMEKRPEKREIHTQKDIQNQIELLEEALELMDLVDSIRSKMIEQDDEYDYNINVCENCCDEYIIEDSDADDPDCFCSQECEEE